MTDIHFESLLGDLQPKSLSRMEDLEPFLCEFLRCTIRQPTHEKAGLGVSRDGASATVEGYLPHPSTCAALETILGMSSLSGLSLDLSPASDSSSSPWFLDCQNRIRGLAGPNPEAGTAHIWEPGDPVRVLREDRGFILCQASDGYLAWADVDEVTTTAERALWTEAAEAPPEEFNPDPNVLKDDWLGVPYVWGGTGRDGVDCSGLAMRFYRFLGVRLPRDSHHQMLGGDLVATHDHRVPLAPWDLLFFTHDDGRIGHVGLSLGGMRVLHAQEGGVCEFSLDPADADHDAYRSRNFVMAKRWLGAGA